MPAIRIRRPAVSLQPAAGAGFVLRIVAITLGVGNLIALLLIFFPPGGSRRELTEQSQSLQSQIFTTRAAASRLKTVSTKVQLGSTEGTSFAGKYFLLKRSAYQTMIGELQRMAGSSELQSRDWVSSEEPIEGTADLTLLNLTANYEGTYPNLIRFLYQVDKSPMLLMLESMQATPQQNGGHLTSALRFQLVIREDELPGERQ